MSIFDMELKRQFLRGKNRNIFSKV